MSITLGIPAGLAPSPEMAMSEGVTGAFTRIQPNNVASITTGTLTAGALSSDSVQPNYPMPVQPLNFSIPCGQKDVWYDPARSTLSFRATYKWNSAGSGYTATSANLRGGASAFFDRITHYSANGQVLDDVVGMAQCSLLEDLMSQNVSDRDSMALNQGFLAETGADSNLFQGHSILSLGSNPASTGSTSSSSYSYDIPLPSSLLGKYAKGWFPSGMVAKLDVVLTTASVLPITLVLGGTATTAPTFEVVLDNFAINLYAVKLDDKSASIVNRAGEHFIHGITHRVSTSTLSAGVQGQTSILLGVRGKSCRALSTRVYEAGAPGTAGCVNGIQDSKYIGASALNYFLGGMDRVPQYPLNSVTNPAQIFSHALQAWEEFTIKGQKYASTPARFLTSLATSTVTLASELGLDQQVRSAGSASTANNLCTFHFSENLQKASSSRVLDGYDLAKSANNFLEINFAYAPTNAITLSTIGKFDIIYVISNGQIEVRM